MSAANIALVSPVKNEGPEEEQHRLDEVIDRHWPLVTYTIEGPSKGSIEVHFPRTRDVEVLVREMSIKHSSQTGAQWYTLDRVNHTCESIGECGTSLTFVTEVPSFDTKHVGETLRSLANWLTERGDESSAMKIKELFPKAFMAPSARHRPWWKRWL